MSETVERQFIEAFVLKLSLISCIPGKLGFYIDEEFRKYLMISS